MQGLRTVLAVLAFASTATASVHTPRPVPPEFAKDTAGAAVDGQVVRQAPSARRQVVAIVPDRTTGKDWGLRYLREAVDDFNRTQPDAVFCVGDLVQGYSRDRAEVLRQRNDFLSIVGRLSMPFYPTPGNHDVVSGTRDPRDPTFADEYRRMFGPLYYSVELDLASFVILNTEDGDGAVQPGFSDAQLAWLDGELARLSKRGRPIILLFHRPLWDHGPTKWSERVQPLLVKHGVDSVIAGHYHALQMLPPRDGIPFMLLGTCGGANDQHPLAGHLHHITFLVIGEDGSIKPYHQVAGCTLPADWMTKEDQDRAYDLKRARDAVRISGAIADPVGRATAATVRVELANPLDREVTMKFVPSTEPRAWTVRDDPKDDDYERVWTSRTPIDIFNPATTDLDTPFRLELPEDAIVLEPKAKATVEIAVSCDAQLAPPQPAPFEVIATYRDERGRRVPVVLRQRVPIARSVELAPSIESAIAYPACVWNWSEYDTTEPDATVRIAARTETRAGAGVRTGLEICVDARDAGLSPLAREPQGRKGLEDPLGDAVRVQFGEGPEAREYMVAFDESGAPRILALSRGADRLEQTDRARAVVSRTEGGWSLRISFEPEALPEGQAPEGMAIQVGVADNDETYHTQWRWLAPRQSPATLRGGGR